MTTLTIRLKDDEIPGRLSQKAKEAGFTSREAYLRAMLRDAIGQDSKMNVLNDKLDWLIARELIGEHDAR